ncbi:MAG: hypothetical protein QGG36_00230 [Pirellulaceae bacterium]|jgi:hypothetical protein|nr:hypothetical protein [Pirellulaceae bacterium]MDP7014202.1 hypothetical protein [Pirellulaceae bacterium]
MNYRHWTAPALLALWLAIFPCVAAAQQGNRVEGLLRTFLEMQLQKEREKALARQRALNPNPTAPRPPTPGRVSSQMQTFRSSMGALSKQANALTNDLQRSSARVRGIRPLMPDALKLKTTSTIMYEQSLKTHDLTLVRDSYRNLDSQWRHLSFQLQQLTGLDASTVSTIRSMDGYCDRLCEVLQLNRQFDRGVVFRQAVRTEAHLRTLSENIEYDLHGLNVQTLASECRGLSEQCRRLSDFVTDGSYDDIVTKYSSFVTDWREFAAKLYPYQDPHCDRCIRRIRASNHETFKHLRLSPSIDRAYLSYVSQRLRREVNLLFEQMTIKALVQLPPTQQQVVLATARDLYGTCEHYCECVENNAPLNDLVADYAKIDKTWSALEVQLAAIDGKALAARRQDITAYGQSIRDLLGVPRGVDRKHAMQLAASLEELGKHLRYDIRRYSRYYRTAEFRDQAFRASDAFYAEAKSLNLLLQTTTDVRKIREGCSRAVVSWEALSRIISAMPQNGLTSSRFQFVDQSRQELLPVMAELVTLFGA